MLGKIIDWVDERSGVRALAQRAFGDSVPGGARVRYVFGSVLTYLFLQQIVIGILLATYYSPSVTDAWASTAYIQDRVAGGWFLRNFVPEGPDWVHCDIAGMAWNGDTSKGYVSKGATGFGVGLAFAYTKARAQK